MLYAGKKYSFSFGRHSLIQILFISWCVQYEGILADSNVKNYLCFKLVYYGAIFKIFVHMKIFITSCHRFLFSCSYFLIDFQKFSPQDQFVGMLAHSNLQKNSLKGLSILPTNSNSTHMQNCIQSLSSQCYLGYQTQAFVWYHGMGKLHSVF